MKDKFKNSLTAGNRLDIRNLADILLQISSVSRQFAAELMAYSQGVSESQDGRCSECVYRTRNSRRAE